MPMDAEVFPALVLGSLQRHLGKLRQTTMEFAAAPPEALTWTQSRPLHDAVELLLQSGRRLGDTATKFSLVLGSAPAASESVKAISDEARAACDSLVAALGVLVDPAARAGAGRPLMELYCQQVRSVLRAMEDLVSHAAEKCLLPSSSGSSELAPKTGVVWAACDQLGKLPRSNKVAFRRAILLHQAAVRDTLREFGELLEQEGSEGGEEEDVADAVAGALAALDVDKDQESEEDDDDLFGGADTPLRDWERANVKRCLVALGHGGDLMKATLAAVDEATAAAGAAGGAGEQQQGAVMAAIVEIEESCQALTAAVVNAADALYPPQTPQELESQLGALVDAAAATAQAVGSLPSPGPAVALCQAEAESMRTAAAGGVVRGAEEEEA